MILRFIILDIKGVYGFWQFSTHGVKSSIPTIRDYFDVIYNEVGEKICKIPFDLNVKKVVLNKPEKKSKYPVVNLVCNISKDRLQLVKEATNNNIIYTEENLNKMIENK